MRFAIPAAGSSGATPATGSNRPRRVRVTFVRARRVVAFVGSRGVATFIRAFRIVMFLAGVCVGVASAAGAAPVDPPANSGSVAEWSDPPALFAAGDSLWVLTHEGTKSSEPSARNTASITVVGRPLAAPAVCATSLPGSRAVLGTLTGVWVGSTDIAAPLQRFLPGSPIRALAVASPERVVALVGDPGPPRDPCEIVLLDCAQGTTIHVADALPTATDLAASMDSTIWVSAAIGRTLQRFTPGFRGWSADSVSVPVQREAPQWSLRLVGTSPSLGPLLLEQGRGTNPSLITMRPVRSIWTWSTGASLRGGVCSADGKTVVLDAVSDVFVIGLDGRAPVPVHPPSHVTAIAISADGSWLALAREPEPGSAIVEMVQPGLPATLTSRILGSSVRALCFAEGAP